MVLPSSTPVPVPDSSPRSDCPTWGPSGLDHAAVAAVRPRELPPPCRPWTAELGATTVSSSSLRSAARGRAARGAPDRTGGVLRAAPARTLPAADGGAPPGRLGVTLPFMVTDAEAAEGATSTRALGGAPAAGTPLARAAASAGTLSLGRRPPRLAEATPRGSAGAKAVFAALDTAWSREATAIDAISTSASEASCRLASLP
mmetsp:Transcript_11448/g.44323  ORF Transcript_11448/g.44323 Transcript_11448/m.44323 type:complete len:202 (-) Transcript_11448:1937-2542(-)